MASFDGLPPLRDTIETYGLDANKALGQNFILDLNLTHKIARDAGDLSKSTVVEIGPGPGGLTRAILSLDAKKLICIERDNRCLPALQEISDYYPDRLNVLEDDALMVDLSKFEDEHPIKIIANLPYNIGTQLLTNWLTQSIDNPFWSSMTLMFQKEVGQRIIAKPGDKHYGRLGVLCGWMTDASISFDVSREAFSPPPKVTSSVVHLELKKNRIPCQLSKLEMVAQAAFGQRRKMLRQSLKSIGGEALLEKVGIEPTRRAETLEIDEFCALAREFE
ncbi:16S rRNA (adenine(1518)-N(6)/adenine(1519)-N(6))-dimethyltransferase RsmA [Lentilitoribacter sp. EG35]|uniref:16S rRNA (adenine(1518)-N(6)/adenine(1519)-N(6))- dimethyltransferase RsmA n=1 Tax=Lentilitoribacter sp. EG35 TaxID=3234192 RepID=UPI00346116E0